ncbi:MAG TPA: exopolysaccharide biosynthesis polyprenyl glycosylphosphotransferase [Candidatus Methylacidiphilales bacterium]|nr:exopolysaccharide biosynthesis polyprenyl glycosylphosphotransferase [Candidatus Methylacidiphilales bacterium]
MISQRKRGLQTVLLLLQSILIAWSLAVCLVISAMFVSLSWDQVSHYPLYAMVMIAGLFLESFRRDHFGKHHGSFGNNFIDQHQVSLNQTLYAAGALFIYLVLTRDSYISRISLGLWLPFLYLTLLFSNRYLWEILAYSLFRGTRKGRILLIGTPPKATELQNWLRSKQIYGMDTLGILSDDDLNEIEPPHNIPLLGTTDDVERVIEEKEITQVILLQLPEALYDYRKLMSVLQRHGVRLLIYNNLEERLKHPVIYFEDDGYQFISLRREPLENPFNRIAKRALDVVIALPVVVFVLPVAALAVWIIQRLYSPGPLFFRQIRAGLQNQRFAIWKFRTMYAGHPDTKQQVTAHDPRIYPGGHFLRRFSLDELPQFINVLRGDMSVTGPRPHLVEHNEQFARQIASYPIRTVVKPGITGLAQVRGFRGEAKTPDDISMRLESDITYLENWRLTLDLAIILRTIWQMVLPPKTAY